MALSKIPINRLDVVLRQVVVLRNADSSAIQICRLIAEQAQGRGKALAGLFVTLTCNRCAERSMGVVPVSAVLLETRTCRRTVEPLQGEHVLRVKNENQPLKSSLVQKDRGGIA